MSDTNEFCDICHTEIKASDERVPAGSPGFFLHLMCDYKKATEDVEKWRKWARIMLCEGQSTFYVPDDEVFRWRLSRLISPKQSGFP